jgi:hypothetical protein
VEYPAINHRESISIFNKQEIDQWLLQNRKATTRELESQAATFVTLKNGSK